jgi:hypothetical protein
MDKLTAEPRPVNAPAAQEKLSPKEWAANVPAAMKELPHWAGHREKVPVHPKTLGRARSNDPGTWGTFEEALSFYTETLKDPKAGVGFMFAKGDGMVFIDLDHAREGGAGPKGRGLQGTSRRLPQRPTSRSPVGRRLPRAPPRKLPRLRRDGREGEGGGRRRRGPTTGGSRPSPVCAPTTRSSTWLTRRRCLDKLLADTKLGERFAYRSRTTPGEEPQRAAEVAEALKQLDSDCEYDKWLNVGMALKAGLGAKGRTPPSRGAKGSKYVPASPSGVASFQREGIGLGTLFRYAEEAGWGAAPKLKEDFAEVAASLPAVIPYHEVQVAKTVVRVKGPGNVRLFFECDEKWVGRIRWNERAGRIELDGRPLDDADLVDLSDAVSRAMDWSPAIDRTAASRGSGAPRRVAADDPVREWSVAPLGREGEADELRAPRAQDNDVTRRYLRRWMVGAVARAYQPGCEMQTMLILQDRRVRKSRFFGTCSKTEWYRESHVTSVTGRSARGACPWIVEVGELSGMAKGEVDKVKVFISEPVSSFRRPYGKVDEQHPRRCVFAGTTNEEAFLKDPTGARRQWVIVAPASIPTPEPAEVEQLWAEARAAYEKGERWWEEGEELAETLTRGEDHLVETTFDEAVWAVAAELEPKGATTMHEVCQLLRERGALGTGAVPTKAIGHVLHRARWESRRTKLDGKMRRVWRLKDATHEAEGGVPAVRRLREHGDAEGDCRGRRQCRGGVAREATVTVSEATGRRERRLISSKQSLHARTRTRARTERESLKPWRLPSPDVSRLPWSPRSGVDQGPDRRDAP